MPGPPRLAVGLLVTLTVAANGCGSSSTTTTITSSPNSTASTSAATTQSTQTTSPSTSPPEARHTTTAAPKTTAQQREKAAAPKRAGGATGSQPSKSPSVQVPLARQYPKQFQRAFIATCTTAKLSTAGCECVIARFEMSKVEKDESFAELLAAERAMKLGLALPGRIQVRVGECRKAHP